MADPRKIRVLVVEDSLTVRRRLLDAIASDPGLEVVAEAENGQQAIELCAKLRPDVITLDMQLPVLDGRAATEHIMGHFPTPILIVSASTNRGDLFNTYDALAAGAVDVLEKPRGIEPPQEWDQKFLAAIKLVSRIRVITHPRARLAAAGRAAVPRTEPPPPNAPNALRGIRKLVAVGASTGGPGALVELLRGIPKATPLAILIVLHIGEPFGVAFADWLGEQTARRVVYARGGESLAAASGQVLMAPPGRHLVVQSGQLWLSSAPERHSCRPSVDVLFESLAIECAAETIACLLTGMGRDGAAGLLALHTRGAFTIAQDEASSIIYGMPREAAVLGAARRILPLSQIGACIAEAASRTGNSS